MDPNFEQTQISLNSKEIYKIGYDSIGLMKYLCQCQYLSNINYFDLLRIILYALYDISEW